jgi:hypothetical protein
MYRVLERGLGNGQFIFLRHVLEALFRHVEYFEQHVELERDQ